MHNSVRIATLGAAVSALALSAGAASAQQVLVAGDYDAVVPNNFRYTYGNFSVTAGGDNGVIAGAGVDGSAANVLEFTTSEGPFGGFGITQQDFDPLDETPTGLDNFSYAFDVLVEGTDGAESGLFVRLVLAGLPDDSVGEPDDNTNSDSIAFQVPLDYDETLGGFQSVAGSFAGATFRPDATLDDLLALGTQATTIQFVIGIDAGATSAFGLDSDNRVVVDNPVVTYAIPEPTSLALLGLGGLTMLRRRR